MTRKIITIEVRAQPQSWMVGFVDHSLAWSYSRLAQSGSDVLERHNQLLRGEFSWKTSRLSNLEAVRLRLPTPACKPIVADWWLSSGSCRRLRAPIDRQLLVESGFERKATSRWYSTSGSNGKLTTEFSAHSWRPQLLFAGEFHCSWP